MTQWLSSREKACDSRQRISLQKQNFVKDIFLFNQVRFLIFIFIQSCLSHTQHIKQRTDISPRGAVVIVIEKSVLTNNLASNCEDQKWIKMVRVTKFRLSLSTSSSQNSALQTHSIDYSFVQLHFSAHICIVVFPAVKHIQLWSFHSTDVMEVGAAETAPFSVRHIKILQILCSCSVLFFSCVLVSY